MRKYNVNKCELMAGKYLVKEDGFISNGTWAIKEDYVLVRKSINAELVTVKEIAKLEKLLLNPVVKTLKDLLMLDRKTHPEKITPDFSKENYVLLPVNPDYSIGISKGDFKRLMNIAPGIELYTDRVRRHQLQIVLNNEIIGVFMGTC